MASVIGQTVNVIRAKRAEAAARVAEREQGRLRAEAEKARTQEAELRQQAELNTARAKTEADKHKQIGNFLKWTFSNLALGPRRNEDTALLLELTAKAEERLKTLANQPSVAAALFSALGGAYANLGDRPKAEAMYRESVRLKRAAGEEASYETTIALEALFTLAGRRGDRAAVEALSREVEAIVEKLKSSHSPEAPDALHILAAIKLEMDSVDEALMIFREALRLIQAEEGEGSTKAVRTLGQIGYWLAHQHKWGAAEIALRQTVALAMKARGITHLETQEAYRQLALLFLNMGSFPDAEGFLARDEQLARAETVYREALAEMDKQAGELAPDKTRFLIQLGSVLLKGDKLAEAESVLRRAVDLQKDKPDTGDLGQLAIVQENLGRVLEKQGRLEEAEAIYKQSLANTQNVGPAPQLGPRHDLARVLEGQKKYAEAEMVYREMRLLPGASYDVENFHNLRQRAEFLVRRGRWKDAGADFAKALDFDIRGGRSMASILADYWYQLVSVLVMSGDMPAYRTNCEAMLAHFGATDDRFAAWQVSKATLMVPVAGSQLEAAARLAHFALTNAVANSREGAPYRAPYQFGEGLSEHRRGNYTTAVEWLQKALAHEGQDLNRDVQAYAVLAMAQQQLKQIDQARAALAKAVHLAQTKLPRLDSGNLGPGWSELLVAHILMREARESIDGSPNPRDETKF